MIHDDDLDWLDALAGRAAGGESSIASREAAGLRAGILSRSIAQGQPIPQTDPHREKALIERARREGLLPHPAVAGARGEQSFAERVAGWIGGWRGLAAAAAVATLAVVAALQWRQPPPAPETPTVRSAPGGVFRIDSAEPAALQKTLLEELRTAGVEATGYERLGLFGIDADLPVPLPGPVREVLDRHRIPAPADGVLMIEIAPPREP